MAKIKVVSDRPLIDGMAVTFRAPCDCNAVDGLTVSYLGVSKNFTFRDAHGNNLAGLGNLFAQHVLIKAVLDTTNSAAYVQNADTNKYLEEKIGTPAQIVKLWENEHFDIEFGATTVTIENITQYDMVEVQYNFSSSTQYTMSQRCAIPHGVGGVYLNGVSGASSKICSRKLDISRDGAFKFSDASAGGSTANTYIIPLAVYGIKGVTSAIVKDPDVEVNG